MTALIELIAGALIVTIVVVVGVAPMYATYLNRHNRDL